MNICSSKQGLNQVSLSVL